MLYLDVSVGSLYNIRKRSVIMKTNLNYFYENFPVVESDNIIMREVLPDDLKDLGECITDVEMYKYWGDNRSTIEKNVIPYYKRVLEITPGEERKCIYWGIALRENNKIIGQIWVNNIQNGRMGHIAYRITRAFWNNGYASEALKSIVKFCFEKTELKRLHTDVDIRNVASCKVLEKCGFIKEGTVRQGKMGRSYCDYHIYSFIKSDYKK